MPLFGSSSQFEADIETATSELNAAEDWALILDICDRAKQSSVASKDCLKCILKRVHHSVPLVAMQALTVLNACVNNCGKVFHLELASREFFNECQAVINSKQTHQKVVQKLKMSIKDWCKNDFKSDPSLSLIPAMMKTLESDGHSFVDEEEVKPSVKLSKDPNVVNSKEEEDDVAKAIAMSLEESSKKDSSKKETSVYPQLSTQPSSNKQTRCVRALYDFEAAEENELTFKAGDIIGVTDDSDANWWRGTSWRGQGLFPANFVTTDINEPTPLTAAEQNGERSEHQETEQQLEQPSVDIVIDEDKINQALELLQNADPTSDESSDLPETLLLEEQCRQMQPMIDQELEIIDRDHSELMMLQQKLTECLQTYHNMMTELPSLHRPTSQPAPLGSSLAQMFNSQPMLSVQQLPQGIAAQTGSTVQSMPYSAQAGFVGQYVPARMMSHAGSGSFPYTAQDVVSPTSSVSQPVPSVPYIPYTVPSQTAPAVQLSAESAYHSQYYQQQQYNSLPYQSSQQRPL